MQDSRSSALPERIGPYRILALLGEGSMGRVYRAREDSPPREIALKVVHAAAPGEFLRRFRREVELLAQLEHPGIARLYAAGTDVAGGGALPYLAMEYVRGSDLVTHARTQGLDLRARLRLLAAVCRAVHYAHTRGIVHRDLKPANILVDESGQPKVLDFGVAHFVQADEATLMTSAGQIIGTLPYMSFEQLAGEARRVDPRSDVYSLGVIAYELIAGQLPFPSLSTASVITAAQLLRSQAPPRLASLVPAARGDVEVIVGKAMALEPERRYASAFELALDLERHLDDRPIEARAPTLGYVVSRFARRHRALSAAVAVAVLALLAATATSLRFAWSEREARAQAEARLAEREAVSGFLARMFSAADPERALGARLAVLDVVDVARRELAADADLPPAVRAQLQRTLGNTYVALARGDPGLELLRAARAQVAAEAGEHAPATRELDLEIAHALAQSGREDEARAVLTPLVAALAQAQPPAPRLDAQARVELGNLEIMQGAPDRAEALMQATFADAQAALGPDDDVTLNAGYQLALALHHQAKLEPSIVQAQDIVARMTRRFGAEHPRTQLARDVIALSYREQGKLAEAEAIYRETVATRERVLGADHPQTHAARVSLAAVLALAGRAAEAAPLARSAHEGMLRQLGADAELTRNVASLRAVVVSELGEWEESIAINRALIAQAEATPGGPTVTDLPDFNNLANQLMLHGHLDEGCTLFATLIAHAARLVGPEHAHYGMFENNYGECLRRQNRLADARRHLEHAYGVLAKTVEPEHPHRRKVEERVKTVYQALGLTWTPPAGDGG